MSCPETPSTVITLGQRGLEIATSMLGLREGPDNSGPDVERFLAPAVRNGQRLRLERGAWCASYLSYCVWTAAHELLAPERRDLATLAMAWDEHEWIAGYSDCPFGYRAAVWEIIEDARATGQWVDASADELPQRGDALCFGRGGHDPRKRGQEGHTGFCEAWGDVRALVSGNDGDEVRRREWGAHAPAPWPYVGFVKIRRLTSASPR